MAHSLEKVKIEFFEFLNDAAGTHAHACAGIRLQCERLANVVVAPVSGAMMLIGKGDPNLPDSRAFHAWPLDALQTRLSANGVVVRELGRQWLVNVFAHWEDHYRGRFGAALHVQQQAVTDPLMGDIRKLRHDIVHHRGIATGTNAGRCSLIAHWVEVDKEIVISTDQIIEFMDYFGLVTTGGQLQTSQWEPTIREAV